VTRRASLDNVLFSLRDLFDMEEARWPALERTREILAPTSFVKPRSGRAPLKPRAPRWRDAAHDVDSRRALVKWAGGRQASTTP